MKATQAPGDRRSYLKRRFVDPLLAFLSQGISPGKLALTVAFGVIWGTFPVIGTNTVICIVTAMVFRLNHAAIQLVNYAVYPLQIALFIPLIQVGLWISGQGELEYTFAELWEIIKTDQWEAFRSIGNIIWCGVVGWVVYAIPLFLLLKITLRIIFVKMSPRKESSGAPVE